MAVRVAHSELIVFCPNVGSIVITPDVLDHFAAHRQLVPCAKEAGGQLFAKIEVDRWVIQAATGPKPSDFRSRFGFRWSRKEAQKEIDAQFSVGLHYVGDWHTHPEEKATPSRTDLKSMTERVALSDHKLPGFVMCIVGTADLPEALWLSFHAPAGHYQIDHGNTP
jgi:integrative and conjugative element protein (TIGR02256 family)